MDLNFVKSECSIGTRKLIKKQENNKDELEETLRLCLILASKFCKVVLTKNDTLETAVMSGRLTIDAHAYMKAEEDKAEQRKRKNQVKNVSKTHRYNIATILASEQDVQIESEELTKATQRIATFENVLRLTSVKVEIKDEHMAVDDSLKK